MHGVTITDREDGRFLTFDLKDILDLIKPCIAETEWTMSDVWSLGPATEEMEALADGTTRVSADLLLRLAKGVTQVIDGVFKGYEQGKRFPWIIIEAVDSSAYDVLSEDDALLQSIRQHFQQVADYPVAAANIAAEAARR